MRLSLFALLAGGAAAAAVPGAATAQRARPACHLSLRAEADADSFTAAGRDAARGARLAQEVGATFAAAASHLCVAGVVRAPQLARYNRLLVRNAEGAANPNIYDDAEEQPGALIIEYAFTDGPAPTQPAVEAALRCWRNPRGAGCATEDVGP